MRFSYFLIVALIISAITAASFYILLQNRAIVEAREIPINIMVADFVGINVDNSELNFGAVMPGSKARRNITFAHDLDECLLVRIQVSENMISWISGYEPYFMLCQGEAREFEFVAQPPPGTPYGNYTGSMFVYFHRPE